MGIRKFTKDERVYFRQKVIDKLLSQPVFEGFKYIKSQDVIIKKTKFGYQKVAMYFNWEHYDVEKQAFAATIMNIGYDVRFNVLHKWFEKYSVKTLKDQRSSYSIGRVATMLEPFAKYPRRYDIVYSGEEFNENMEKMVKDMVEIATYFFNKHKSLEDLYETLVIPVLEGEKELPDVGADWIFEYLTLTKLVDSENYERLKELILGRTKWMNAEPNIIRYKDNLDEIFEYLEVLELEMPPAFPSLLENNVKENEDIYNAIDDEESEQSKILNDIEYIDCSQNKNSNLQKEYDNYFSQFDEEYIANIMRECCKKFNSGINKDKITWSDFYNCMREYALDFLEYDEGLIDQIDELLITEEDDF